MIVDPTGVEEAHADRIFRALAHHTRRDIIRRAMNGTLSVSGLARLYPMSTTAVQKHVAVLEEAELVRLTRRGREQFVQTEIDTVAKAQVLLAEFERLWRGRLDRIGDVLAEPVGGDRS
jgi:DNA-binding transcriptional ArsR family regulator